VCRTSTQAPKLKTHIEKHINQSRFRCTVCRKKYVFKWEIDHHLKERHGMDPEVDYWTEASDYEENPRLRLRCLLCDEMMRSREAVLTHAKYHNLGRESKGAAKEEMEENLNCKLEAMEMGNAIETQFDPPGKREWQCVLCRAKKQIFAEFNVHIMEHIGAKFVCRACPFAYSSHREAARHMASKHPHRPPGLTVARPDDIDLMDRLNTRCSICDEEIRLLKTLELHISLHNAVVVAEDMSEPEEPPVVVEDEPDYIFICSVCKAQLQTRPTLTGHLSIHFKEYRYKCKKCESGFVWHRSIEKHIESFHDKQEGLIEVLGSHASEQNDFKCAVCQEEMPDKKAVYMHTELHSDSTRVSEPFGLCPLCKKTVEKLSLLKAHISKHLEVHKFQCVQCPQGDTFLTLSAASQHMRERHSSVDIETGFKRIVEMPTGPLNLQCAVCTQLLENEEMAFSHGEKHSQAMNLPAKIDDAQRPIVREQPLSCPICPKQIMGRDKLKIHVRRHWYTIYYSCNLCKKEFPVLQDLQNHAQTDHEGIIVTATERSEENVLDTVCQACGEKITSKKDTKVHAFLHNFHRSDRFTCTLCYKMFATLSEWTDHKLTAQCQRSKYTLNDWFICLD